MKNRLSLRKSGRLKLVLLITEQRAWSPASSFFSMTSRREDMDGKFTENYVEKRVSYKQNYQVMLLLQLKLFLVCESECNVI